MTKAKNQTGHFTCYKNRTFSLATNTGELPHSAKVSELEHGNWNFAPEEDLKLSFCV